MTPNTATQIAGRAFANCIMNAAGVCDYTRADLDAMQNSSAASFVTKSATVSPREGNPEPRYRLGQHQFHGSAQFRTALLFELRFTSAARAA